MLRRNFILSLLAGLGTVLSNPMSVLGQLPKPKPRPRYNMKPVQAKFMNGSTLTLVEERNGGLRGGEVLQLNINTGKFGWVPGDKILFNDSTFVVTGIERGPL